MQYGPWESEGPDRDLDRFPPPPAASASRLSPPLALVCLHTLLCCICSPSSTPRPPQNRRPHIPLFRELLDPHWVGSSGRVLRFCVVAQNLDGNMCLLVIQNFWSRSEGSGTPPPALQSRVDNVRIYCWNVHGAEVRSRPAHPPPLQQPVSFGPVLPHLRVQPWPFSF